VSLFLNGNEKFSIIEISSENSINFEDLLKLKLHVICREQKHPNAIVTFENKARKEKYQSL